MRPIELKIKGINSYREEQVINFNQLTSQGFFGIFGPTGSGKSTILDAITLALYAKLPRGSKNFININETSASVSFRFSITTTETKEYLVERSFRYPGKDRSSTARNTTARLSLLSDVDTEILADKPTDVTRSCTDLPREIIILKRKGNLRLADKCCQLKNNSSHRRAFSSSSR